MTVMAAEAAGATEASAGAGAASTGAAGGLAAGGPPQPQQRQPKQRKPPKASKIHRGNYQAIILMEFVAVMLLTAMTPIATKKDDQGLSPYAGADIVKLASLTGVYLILAMISVGGRTTGRLAAWFGGLILLTDGLYEASNIAKDLQVFGGGGQPKAGAPAPAAVHPQGPGQAAQ